MAGNIRELNAPGDLGLRPDSRADESLANSGRRISALYDSAANAKTDEGRRLASGGMDVGEVAVKYMDQKEISAGAANGAELIANVNDAWNKKLKDPKFDPNDATAAAQFREETLEPILDKFKSGFNTEKSQQWAEQFTDRYRTHMFEKTAADMSTMASVAVKTNYEKTKNMLSSAVASDPSSLDFALSSVDHSLGAMVDSSPNLDATTSAKVKLELAQDAKQAIVKAAISGMITKNPNVDLDSIQKKYGEYVNGADMKMFQKAAQTQAKVDQLQQKQLEAYQRQQEEHAANTSLSKVITDNVSIDPATNRPVIKPQALQQTLDIAKKYPQAGPAVARTMIDWIENQQNKDVKAVDDPTIVKGLSDRLFDPEKPTTTLDLMRARTQGKISDHTFTVMSGLVKELDETPLKGPVYQETMKAAHDQLVVNVPGIPGKDTVGTTKYAQFIQSFVPQYIAKSRAGTLEPNALDVSDPTSMISKAIAPFKRSPAQRMSDYVSAAGGLGGSPTPAPAAARKVGDVTVPAALGGVAALQYNPDTKQWRDSTSGTVYDASGNKVK